VILQICDKWVGSSISVLGGNFDGFPNGVVG
jgi:hypothetical protein